MLSSALIVEAEEAEEAAEELDVCVMDRFEICRNRRKRFSLSSPV